jgi:hypothetical protein
VVSEEQRPQEAPIACALAAIVGESLEQRRHVRVGGVFLEADGEVAVVFLGG